MVSRQRLPACFHLNLTATEGLNKWALVIGILAPSTSQPELIEDDWTGNSDRLKVKGKLATNF